MKHHITATLKQSQLALSRFMQDSHNIDNIERAARILINGIGQGKAVYSCGNGGSMSDAMHFAEELTGRYRENRLAMSATAISDPGHISCVANDYGYEYIFSRYLEACAREGDTLLAISTSGTSKNVIKAAEYALDHGMNVISLTGKAGSTLGLLASVDICVGASDFADRIQELHIKVIHILIELIEREICPQNYG